MINKDTIKYKKESVSLNTDSEIINPCRDNEQLARCITPYENIYDISVSITGFDLSLESCIK